MPAWSMSRTARQITCSSEDREKLKRLAASRTEAKQLVERARIVLGCLAGKRVQAVARECDTRPNTVIKWRQRFAQTGLAGLADAPRPGAQPVYGVDFRNRVLALLEQPPPAGQAAWDGPAVAARLNGSVHAVWRVLRREGICLQRQRSWCVSTDKEFAAKAADVIGLYLNPPANALVISVERNPAFKRWNGPPATWKRTTAKLCAASKAPINDMAPLICSRRCKWPRAKSRRPPRRSNAAKSSYNSWIRSLRRRRRGGKFMRFLITIARTKNATPGWRNIPTCIFISRRPRPAGSIRWRSGLASCRARFCAGPISKTSWNCAKPSKRSSRLTIPRPSRSSGASGKSRDRNCIILSLIYAIKH